MHSAASGQQREKLQLLHDMPRIQPAPDCAATPPPAPNRPTSFSWLASSSQRLLARSASRSRASMDALSEASPAAVSIWPAISAPLEASCPRRLSTSAARLLRSPVRAASWPRRPDAAESRFAASAARRP